MGIVQTRRDIKRLKARRANLATVIADKVEERRRLSEVLRSKKDRDPAQQERKEELHREILLLGEEVEQTSQEIDRRRGRRGVVTKKLAKLARKLMHDDFTAVLKGGSADEVYEAIQAAIS